MNRSLPETDAIDRTIIGSIELKKIPAQGAALLICNRLSNGGEFQVIKEEVKSVRQDIIFIEDHFKKKELQLAKKYLQAGYLLVMMPSRKKRISNREPKWRSSRIEFIKNCKSPIIPIFLQDAQDQTLFRIGRAIKIGNAENMREGQQISRKLRARLLCLGIASQNVKKTSTGPLKVIRTPFDRSIIRSEVEKLGPGHILCEQGSFRVYVARSYHIPHLINEIGRLRELTFSAVGEGSRQFVDLDEYDQHYHHMFAWDTENNRLAGAYRMGMGPEILPSYGKAGFYLHSLFQIKQAFLPILGKSLELGRSFVVEDYQQKRLPLFLLWKGISHFVSSQKKIEYLIGPVSISDSYSKLSKSVIYQYIINQHFDWDLAQHVKPRKAFRPDFAGLDADALIDPDEKNPRKIDQILEDIEPRHFKMPILLKKYFAQNAKIIGFNVDPDFSSALDGFMICRTTSLAKEYRG